MGSRVHELRDKFRAALACGQQLVGTFVKLPHLDVIEMAFDSGLDFVVVDLEHSSLSVSDAIALLRHSDMCGLAALVRVPDVDRGLINRLLENGAVGIQLSTLQTVAQKNALHAATRYAPDGRRSVSLAHRTAEFASGGLAEYLRREGASPPLLVGQIETAETDPLVVLLGGLDVCFVGTTDLAVDLCVQTEDLAQVISSIRDAAGLADAAFGCFASSKAQAKQIGIEEALFMVVSSDAQMLANGLRTIGAHNSASDRRPS